MEPLGRVFAAVPLPPEVAMGLADRLSVLPIPGRVVPPKNWHITLRFLGSVDVVTYERFLSGLDLSEVVPFPISLSGISGFPRAKKAAVVWVGVDEGKAELGRLNEIAEEAAQAAGLEPEERPFRPHLSLSRVRPPEDISSLIQAEIGLRWRGDRLVVYRSRLGRGGARYEPLETLRFGE